MPPRGARTPPCTVGKGIRGVFPQRKVRGWRSGNQRAAVVPHRSAWQGEWRWDVATTGREGTEGEMNGMTWHKSGAAWCTMSVPCVGRGLVRARDSLTPAAPVQYLFYFFGVPPSPVVLHFHFGMSGAFKTSPLPAPEPRATTRLRLVWRAPLGSAQPSFAADLSAMTVLHGGQGEGSALTRKGC